MPQRSTESRGLCSALFACACALVLEVIPRAAFAQAPDTSTPANAAPEVIEATRELFRQGAQLASEGRWEEARERFQRALAIRATPLTRFNLALAAQNSGHLVEALDQYRQFLRDDNDPANAARRQQAQRAIAEIEPRLAHLTITVTGADQPSAVDLDGRAIPLVLLGVDVPVDPGEHIVRVRGQRGGASTRTVTLAESARESVVIVLDPPPAARPAPQPNGGRTPASPLMQTAQGTHPPAQGAGARPASRPGPIERIRRSAEERARMADAEGRRRWERTVVLGAITGAGHAVGLLGVTARWAARPWFDFEVQIGAANGYGPAGVGLMFTLRYPWSYRYSLGLLVGVSTNWARVGHEPCGYQCNFAPLWITPAITHEWRTGIGLTYRLAIGARILLNHHELADAWTRNTGQQPDTTLRFADLFVGRVSLDHRIFPVLPCVTFDIGWSL